MKRPLAIIGFTYFFVSAFLYFLPETAYIYALGLFLLLFFASLLIKTIRKEKTLPASFLTCVIAVVVCVTNQNLNIKPAENLNDTDALITGTICELPYVQNSKYNYTINIKKIDDKEIKPLKIKLSCPKALDGDVFDEFTGHVHIYIPQNSPSFDSQAYYRTKNIYVHASLYDYKENSCKTQETRPPYYYILKLRQKMISSSKQMLPISTASVINGILLGEKHEFPQNVKMDFHKTGVYHLLATSGIHVSILSSFFLALFKKLSLNKKVAAVFAACAVLLFMALTCFTPSIMRAGIMSIICLIGMALSKQSDSLNSLGIAVLVICAINPNAALDIGLWMSFLSALGIITIHPHINSAISKKMGTRLGENIFLKYIASSVSISLSVWLSTLPISAWFFGKTSLISPISNLLLIIPTTFLLNLSLITELMFVIGIPKIIVRFFAAICGRIANLVVLTTKLLARIPFSMISLDYGFVNLWISFTLILLSISLLLPNLKKCLKTSLLISLNLLLAGILSYQLTNAGKTNITVLNCSDGIGVVIDRGNRRAAIIALDENSSTVALEDCLCLSYIQNMDYLNLSVLNESNKIFASNIIQTYAPEISVFSSSKSAEVSFESDRTHAVYFSGNVKTHIWENTDIETLEIDKNTFIKLTVSGTTVLIAVNGGNADKLPASWKSCSIFLAGGIPVNYKNIDFQNCIISMNRRSSEIGVLKFSSDNKSVLSTAHQGKFHINIDTSGKYKIRRIR